MFYGFQVNEGEVVLHILEHLNLAFVVRMIDNEQVNRVI